MKVDWSNTALGHLVEIYDYISRDSPRYAQRMVHRLTSRSKQAGAFPHSGQMVAEYQRRDIRELIEGPYRIIYRTDPDQVVVLAVIHGASLPPSQLP